MNDRLLYWAALAVVKFLQALPLRAVARIGRAVGAAAYCLDARHRRVALENLTMCFGAEKTESEIRQLARENFQRLGENYCGAIKTAVLSADEMQDHLEFVGAEKIRPYQFESGPQSRIIAIGHFGNFELYTHFGEFTPIFTCGSTYRGLPQPSLNRLMQSMRERSGCIFFERRTEGARLKAALNETGLLLGLLADQHGGDRGIWVPFLGHDCSTSTAPAVFALRYQCPLHTAICYRTGLGKWRIEVGEEIPTHENGVARSTEIITREMNRAFEAAVRRDPANWFWVHRRWKPRQQRPQVNPIPPPAREENAGSARHD